MNIEAVVKKALAIRRKVEQIEARHKEELAPYKEGMKALEAVALQLLERAGGAKSIRTEEGTVYQETLFTATVKDRAAFLDFVIENGKLDMLTSNLAKDAVRAYCDETNAPPPGVEVGGVVKIKFRQPS